MPLGAGQGPVETLGPRACGRNDLVLGEFYSVQDEWSDHTQATENCPLKWTFRLSRARTRERLVTVNAGSRCSDSLGDTC